MITGGAPVAVPQRIRQAENSQGKRPPKLQQKKRGTLWPKEWGLITPVACWDLAMGRYGVE